MKTVICKSGVKGWQAKLRSVYNTFEEFEQYNNIYSIAKRIGYKSVERAWKDNPTIQGSINPSDLTKIS